MAALIEILAAGAEALREEAFEDLLRDAPSLGSGEIEALIQALAHPALAVREAVSAALSQVGPGIGRSADRIAAALRDPDPTVRGNVAFALGGIGGIAALEVLEDLYTALGLEDDDWASASMGRAIDVHVRA